jgi:hypothetical protein
VPAPKCSACGHKLVSFCPSCRAKKSSPKRVKASRENGKKGGRPKKVKQNRVVFVDEGGGTYIPKDKKP